MDCWMMVWWVDGLMVWWLDGLMDWWIDGLMVWWFDGLMDWWFDGLMDWWFDGFQDRKLQNIWYPGGGVILESGRSKGEIPLVPLSWIITWGGENFEEKCIPLQELIFENKKASFITLFNTFYPKTDLLSPKNIFFFTNPIQREKTIPSLGGSDFQTEYIPPLPLFCTGCPW